MPQTIQLQVNGDCHTYASDASDQSQRNVPTFLTSIGLNPRLVAVEYNGEILHRQFWQDTLLQDGDRLEIVTIVGGG